MYSGNEFRMAERTFKEIEDAPLKELTSTTATDVDRQSEQGFVRCGCRKITVKARGAIVVLVVSSFSIYFPFLYLGLCKKFDQ